MDEVITVAVSYCTSLIENSSELKYNWMFGRQGRFTSCRGVYKDWVRHSLVVL